jgi:mannose-6-phosphate isomerase-like protein (cupin superfamily)
MNETTPSPVERIEVDGILLALIVRALYSEPGLKFFTPDDFSQQLAYMRHPQGKIIAPHVHNEVKRTVHFTQEVLFIRKGRLRVDFYKSDRTYVVSRLLGPGDVVLLSDGGHGFECLEELEMIEVKQGPYAGEMDKVRFDPVESRSISYSLENS